MIIGTFNLDGTSPEPVDISTKGRFFEVEACIVRHPRRYPTYKVDGNTYEAFQVTLKDGGKDGFSNLGDALEALVRSYYPNSVADGSSVTPILVSANNIKGTESEPNLGRIALSVGVGLAVAMAYLMIRHGISRAFVAAISSFAASFLAVAFFVITRIPVTPVVALGAVGTAVIALLINLIVMQKAKEVQKDLGHDKTRTLVEIKADSLMKATSQNAYEFLVLATIIAWAALAYLLIGPVSFNAIYCSLIVGILVSVVLTLTLYAFFANLLMKGLSKIHIKMPQRKKKVGQLSEKRSKSAEPTEATFIGIND